jgi:hypothetical protein
MKTCLWARAVDKAGNASANAFTTVASDIAAPSAPVVAPSYDPTSVAVRAPYVNLFVDSPPTDAAWGGAPWAGIAWLELDTGAGFQPLCPAAACHANNAYNPCGCGCTDPAIRCAGSTFLGLRVPLADGNRNIVAVRAVDLAGNASSGVAQEIDADATASPLAVTPSMEWGSRVLGSVVFWLQETTGILTDLGSDRRLQATDPTCSFPSTGGALGSQRMLFYQYAGSGKIRRAGSSAATFCVSDTETPLTGIDFSNAAIAASGERIAWAGGNTGALAVREAGPNGTVGDPDDLTTVLAAGWSWTQTLRLAGRQLAVIGQPCDTCSQVSRVYSAGIDAATGQPTFQRGVTAYDFPWPLAREMALPADGSYLARVDFSTSPASIAVQYPTNGRFGAGDQIARLYWPTFLSTPGLVAADGNHVVAAGAGDLVHWDAGPDGRFGTADDIITQPATSRSNRDALALSAGLLLYEESRDVLSLDLTSMSWVSVPTPWVNQSIMAMTAGSIIYRQIEAYGRPASALCWDGRETLAPGRYYSLAASGDYVVGFDQSSAGIYLFTRDVGGTGCFFTGSATTVPLLTNGLGSSANVAVNGEHAAASIWDGSKFSVVAFEPPVGQPLSFSPTTVTTLQAGIISGPFSVALAPKQAIFSCQGVFSSNEDVCLKSSGADGRFGTGDDGPVVRLVHPPNSACAGQPVVGTDLALGGTTLAIMADCPWGFAVISAGPDGLFNTADDRETRLSSAQLYAQTMGAAPGFVTWVQAASPGGDQVFLWNEATGLTLQLTSHYSKKTNPLVDAQGRVWWADGVFPDRWSLWSRTP